MNLRPWWVTTAALTHSTIFSILENRQGDFGGFALSLAADGHLRELSRKETQIHGFEGVLKAVDVSELDPCSGAIHFYQAPVTDVQAIAEGDNHSGAWTHPNPADWIDNPHTAAPSFAQTLASYLATCTGVQSPSNPRTRIRLGAPLGIHSTSSGPGDRYANVNPSGRKSIAG